MASLNYPTPYNQNMPETITITAVAGWLAGILGFAAFLPYIVAIIRGKTTPNRATWLIWTIVGVVAGSSYYIGGANDTIWVAISFIAGPFIIFVLSIKRGEGGWTLTDRVCLFTACVSVLLWWLSGSALLGLCMGLVADLMGASPTILKAYRRPEGEDRASWAIWFIAGAINLVAIEDWGAFSIVVYPVYMFLCAGTIAALLWLRPLRIHEIG